MFTLVARGPKVYKGVGYNTFRYIDLKEGSDGVHSSLQSQMSITRYTTSRSCSTALAQILAQVLRRTTRGVFCTCACATFSIMLPTNIKHLSCDSLHISPAIFRKKAALFDGVL